MEVQRRDSDHLWKKRALNGDIRTTEKMVEDIKMVLELD